MQKLTGIITLSAILLLGSGCSYFGVYKRDLPQGNLVTADMVDQLQTGMSRDQVIEVMGSPLLTAPFDASEWDYVFRLDEAYGGIEQRRVTLSFDGDRLDEIAREGDLDQRIELHSTEGSDGIGPATGGADPGIPAPEPGRRQPQPEGTLPQAGEPAERSP